MFTIEQTCDLRATTSLNVAMRKTVRRWYSAERNRIEGAGLTMNRKSVLSVPMSCFWAVVAVCVLGIAIGSFADFRINEALASKTALGSLFATYGSYFSYCLYPAAGACLYAGLREKGEKYRMLAWTLLILCFFLAEVVYQLIIRIKYNQHSTYL